MKTMKQNQYFDDNTEEQTALEYLAVCLLTDVKQMHIDWFADNLEEPTYNEFLVDNGHDLDEKKLYEFNLLRQSRTSKITAFTAAVHLPANHKMLLDHIRYDLVWEGVSSVLERVPFLFREDSTLALIQFTQTASEEGISWL